MKLAETMPVSFEEIKEGQFREDKGSVDLLAELNNDASKSAQMDNPPSRMKNRTPTMIKTILKIFLVCFIMAVSITLIYILTTI